MMNNIYYQGADGHTKVLGDDELAHYKYIKKIGNRYFYTTEALQAYYRDQKMVANAEYAKDRTGDRIDKARRNAELYREYQGGIKKNSPYMTKEYEKHKARSDALYEAQGTYRKAKKTVKPIAKTAKRAVTPIKTPKERAMDFLNKHSDTKPKEAKRKKKKITRDTVRRTSKEGYRNYKRSGSNSKRVSSYQSKVRGA